MKALWEPICDSISLIQTGKAKLHNLHPNKTEPNTLNFPQTKMDPNWPKHIKCHLLKTTNTETNKPIAQNTSTTTINISPFILSFASFFSSFSIFLLASCNSCLVPSLLSCQIRITSIPICLTFICPTFIFPFKKTARVPSLHNQNYKKKKI